jgi:hypothetical protein
MTSFLKPRRLAMLPMILLVGLSGCVHDTLPTVLRDELVLLTELVDRLLSVKDEATAKDYMFHEKQLDKKYESIRKRELDLSMALGFGSRASLIIESGANKNPLEIVHSKDNETMPPGEYKLDEFRAALGRYTIDKLPAMTITGAGREPDERTRVEWDAFTILREKSLGEMRVPHQVVFKTNEYNNYIKEKVNIRLLNQREATRIEAALKYNQEELLIPAKDLINLTAVRDALRRK